MDISLIALSPQTVECLKISAIIPSYVMLSASPSTEEKGRPCIVYTSYHKDTYYTVTTKYTVYKHPYMTHIHQTYVCMYTNTHTQTHSPYTMLKYAYDHHHNHNGKGNNKN